MESKLEKRIMQLKEKQEKLRNVIQNQTEQLKKVTDDLDQLEQKKNAQMLKSFQSKLRKEGLPFDEGVLDKVIDILKEQPSEEVAPGEAVENPSEEQSTENTTDDLTEDVPSVPQAFR